MGNSSNGRKETQKRREDEASWYVYKQETKEDVQQKRDQNTKQRNK